MNVPSAFACSLLGVLSVAPRLPASSLDDLEWVNPRPHGHTLLGIARGNGIYVAAGTGGTLQTSSDHGATWTQQNAVVDPDRRYESVEFLNGKFYAVGAQRFEGLISCSPDGVDWDHQVLPGSGAITAIAYGNNTFVTTGETYTSSDGQTWAPGESFADNGSDITFGDGLFVAVDRGFSFRSSIRTSPDGVEWTPVRNNDVLTQLSAVTHGNGRFVAVGFQQSMESADGEEWSTNPQGFSFTPNDVDFRDGVFYATGQNVQSSSDGIAWNFEVGFQYFDPVTFEPVSSNFGYGIAHSDTSLVSVGTSGDIWNKVGDGDWTRRSEGFTLDPLSDVTHGTVMVNGEPVGKYVATHSTLNAGSPGGLMVSDDGSRWTSAQRTGPDLRAVVIGNHRIVAVGKFSDSNAAPTRVYTSDDGVAFEEHALPVSGPLLDVAFAGDTFVAVGQTGFIFTSTDTGGGWSEWTQQESGVDFTLNAVAHGNGRFVAVGSPVPILESADGVTWNPATGETTHNFFSVAYGSGIFVASGGVNSMTSPDGLMWTERTFPEGAAFRELKFLDNQFVGISFLGAVWTSGDGLDWIEQPRFTAHTLNGVTFDGSAYYLVGFDPWNPITPTIIRSAVEGFPFELADLRRLANGDVQFKVFGNPGDAVEIRATSDLGMWDVLDTIQLDSVPTLYTDTTAADFGRRIYQGRTGVPEL